MDHEPTKQFGRIQTNRTRGYPIDAELRRANGVGAAGVAVFPILRALTAWLLRNETQAAHKEYT